MSDAAQFDDRPDFSLVLGGLLYQLCLRLRMAQPPLDLLTRRMLIIPLIAWLPLLLLSALGRQVVGGGITVCAPSTRGHVSTGPSPVGMSLSSIQRTRPLVHRITRAGPGLVVYQRDKGATTIKPTRIRIVALL
ncbi:MAG: hypothetical protein ACRERE_29550 [Candidatus Entotheonellia bacterium]